jgi:hypothetical protein
MNFLKSTNNLLKQLVSAGFIMIFCSCSKQSVSINSTAAALMGKWNLISDSEYTGVGTNNHLVGYIGQPGDYFDFSTNQNVYIKEGTIYDTVRYQVVTSSTIIIADFGLIGNGVQDTSKIVNLTPDSVTIVSPVSITPGGIFGRTVHLGR